MSGDFGTFFAKSTNNTSQIFDLDIIADAELVLFPWKVRKVFRHCGAVWSVTFRERKVTKSSHSSAWLFEVTPVPWRHIARNNSFRRPLVFANRSLTVCSTALEANTTTRQLSIVAPPMGCSEKILLYVALNLLIWTPTKILSKLILTQAYATFRSSLITSCRNLEVSLGEYKKSYTYLTLYQ